MEDKGAREEEGLTEDGCRRWCRWQGAAKSGPRRADERKMAAAGAPSGEDQLEPSGRCLVVLDALPEGELVDLLMERMETRGSGVGAG
jgi:hypothetical protein